jgi:hypothetical protein
MTVSSVKESVSPQTPASNNSPVIDTEFKEYVRQKLYDALRQDCHLNEKPQEKAERPQEKALVPIS